jgi:hypothetical protein
MLRIKHLRRPVMILSKILNSCRIKLLELNHQVLHIQPSSIAPHPRHTTTQEVSIAHLQPHHLRPILIVVHSIVLHPRLTTTQEASIAHQQHLLRQPHIRVLNIAPQLRVTIIRGRSIARLLLLHLLLLLYPQLIRQHSIVHQLKVTIIRGPSIAPLSLSLLLLPLFLRPIQLCNIVHQQKEHTTQEVSIALPLLLLLLLPLFLRLIQLHNIVHLLRVTIIRGPSIAHLQRQRQRQHPPLHIRQLNTALQLRPITIPGHSRAQQ